MTTSLGNWNIKLFKSQRETVPSHIINKNEEAAESEWIDLWNYNASVLYAVSWEELINNPLTKKVLWINEIDDSTMLKQLLVWPRPWTITPWSSKVGDILNWVWVEWTWRVEKVIWHKYDSDDENSWDELWKLWHDKMTQIVVPNFSDVKTMFNMWEKLEMQYVDIKWKNISALVDFNKQRGVWLSMEQMVYLLTHFSSLKRNPTDAEIFAFAQANSEHCHHDTFTWKHIINWKKQTRSLFDWIKNTHAQNPNRTLSAYKDNAAALKWAYWSIYFVWKNGRYNLKTIPLDNVVKVESHNHPTWISPEPWAATWSGWEIRDEWAVWKWSTPNTWTSGFFVSNLDETPMGLPDWRASSKQIMTEAPVWAAWFNNEFGRPAISWDFRVFEQKVWWKYWGYHKPIMLAWGKWNIFPEQIEKWDMPVWTLIIQIWWPCMNIWLGWWSWSSAVAWSLCQNLDFASVQRANPEMERRCQELINTCTKLWKENPIIAIHDVWAWWDWNAIQEFVYDSGKWGVIDFSKIPVADPSMSPLEIWSNESQERYILGILPDDLERFKEICLRENTPFYVFWNITEWRQFTVNDPKTWKNIIDMDIWAMLDHNVPLELTDNSVHINWWEINYEVMNLLESIAKVISHPTVWNKSFLVTIWDRTVWWITTQNQMVWPWQTPVSNVWVTLHGMEWLIWEVIVSWERTPLSIINPAASVRMAIWESITNLMSAYISDFESIAWSWNWMADKSEPGQLAALHEWVDALDDICVKLWISIPVWKDSLSMKTKWPDWDIVAPLSFISTFTAETLNVNKTLTPELKKLENTELFLIDLWEWKNRMWWSILAQVYNQFWNETPDINPDLLLNFMKAMRELHENWLLLAYHDRSDWGLLTTLSEMSFASHLWMDIHITTLNENNDKENILKTFFSEELWVVIQMKSENRIKAFSILRKYNLMDTISCIWKPNLESQYISMMYWEKKLIVKRRIDLQKAWSQTSYKIQKWRDNPEVADQEFARISDEFEPPMPNIPTFDILDHEAHKIISDYEDSNKPKPKVAILRTQWINGQQEMARYFYRAWFDAYDVHLNDLISWKVNLNDFSWISGAWGFSYWDALWAWVWLAQTILNIPKLKKQFEEFEWFFMWVCNSCQMIWELWKILPGGEKFPKFKRNTSAQFEARLSPVKIKENSDSIFLKWMWWSVLPVISSHWEWRVEWGEMEANLNYVDHHCNETQVYPHNPNGSENWATWFELWKIFFMMWHPEREWDPNSPWLQIPLNLRKWVEDQKKV